MMMENSRNLEDGTNAFIVILQILGISIIICLLNHCLINYNEVFSYEIGTQVMYLYCRMC